MKIQLMLMTSLTCIGNILMGDEILHEDMQVLQLGGDVGCQFCTYFLHLFPLFYLMTRTIGTTFAYFSYHFILTCVVSPYFHYSAISSIIMMYRVFFMTKRKNIWRRSMVKFVVFSDAICSTKYLEHEAYRSS